MLKNQPIQNFFLRLINGESYEMVDGQQRARTIFAYYKGVISDINGDKYSGSSTFLSYPLNMTIISKKMFSQFCLIKHKHIKLIFQEVLIWQKYIDLNKAFILC